MSVSRRDFLSSGAAAGAGLALIRVAQPPAIFAGQDAESAPASQSRWPMPPRYREVLRFDQEWRFARADGSVHGLPSPESGSDLTPPDDAGWESVVLPHSVRLEPLDAGGGENFQGVCWYQKQLIAKPEWRGRVVQLIFEAAMSVADVWLDGHHLTTHYGGYLPFVLDLSQRLDFESGRSHALTVRLNNKDNPEVPPGKPQNQLDFVYFGGLYRGVRLEIANSLHISDPIAANKPAGGGIFVTYPAVSKREATVQVQVDVANASRSTKRAAVRLELQHPDGSIVASAEKETEVAAEGSIALTQAMTVSRPLL
ncbi:sugar-binding domain-containing protein, partial [Silvibacterium sp.]|uniref:sugar-binding domain-containing protein n=1 Tax=Silvibacterium sp. TaxID=1964179 RepID=UPI0039E69F66